MSDCLFCRIVAGHIPADIVFENDSILAFKDIHPKAPVHILVIPKTHLATLNELTQTDKALAGEILLACATIAQQHDIAETGYRVVNNCNAHGGQEVYHLHLHLLGGKALKFVC